MSEAKFGVGDRVRHVSLGRHGIVVEVDLEYTPAHDDNGLTLNPDVRSSPWYLVTIDDEQGAPVDTYLAEGQLTSDG
ncbi:heat shock protein HspQ [Nocardia brasiliensis]|uniref:heat shock protein HspQ n=1 Tax=Nocardia brasiliensis TaxID=37326 RepID=UPI0033F0EDA5